MPIWPTASLISPILLLERLIATGEAEVADPQSAILKLQGYTFQSNSQAERITQNINKKLIFQRHAKTYNQLLPELSSWKTHSKLHTYSHLNPGTMLTGLRAPSSLCSSTKTSTLHLWFIISDTKQRSETACASWNFLWKQNPRVHLDAAQPFTAVEPHSTDSKFSLAWCKCKLSITRVSLIDSRSILGFCNPSSGHLNEVNRSFALTKDRKIEPSSHFTPI